MSQINDSEEVKHDISLANAYDPWCNTCFRYKEAGETGCLNLGDGRQLCSDCSSIAVTNLEECNFIIQNVFEFYRILNLKVDEKIPIFFVDKIQMSRISQDRFVAMFIPRISAYFTPSTAGIPLRVKMMLILARFIIRSIQTIEKYSGSGGGIKKVVKLPLGEAIVLLFGTPGIEMGATLAHEMMHGWFRLQGMPWGCENRTEEGICQVMSYKWLQWFSSSGLDTSHKTIQQVQYTRKLKEFLVEEIRCREDEVYGQGFRDAMHAVETFGFKTTLDHAVKNGTLPLPMMDSTRSTATATAVTTTTKKLIRKNTSATPITRLLWKATSNTTKSLWKATAAAITDLLWKAATTYETPRFIIMEGHCHNQYHQGQSHKNLQEGMSLSPMLLVFIGILIEHR